MTKLTSAHRALARASAPRANQRGIVLLIALVAVFMLMLAGLATLRSVGTTTLLTGNLAFREATVQSADYGLEDARNWLIATTTTSASSMANAINNSSAAYYPSWVDSFDPRSYDWNSTGNSVTVATAPTGFTVQYVIHRMCATAGDYLAATATCILASGTAGQGFSKGSLTYASFNLFDQGTGTPYYRITTRVTGPRNAVSYVQAMVY